MRQLIGHYSSLGGLTSFAQDYRNRRLNGVAATLTDEAHGRCFTASGLENSLGEVLVPAAVWKEMCLIGYWVSESIILRWAELTVEMSEQRLQASEVVEEATRTSKAGARHPDGSEGLPSTTQRARVGVRLGGACPPAI
jgi:hypothetical protein